MLLLRLLAQYPVRCGKRYIRRLGSVPFQDDLDPLEDEAFGLEDFKHYEPTEQTRKQLKNIETAVSASDSVQEHVQPSGHRDLEAISKIRSPLAVVSKLSNPFLNLAIEDYIYNNMPFKNTQDKKATFNRLMFYVNSPCVVIGKNQNPWKEVNLPLLTSLRIPLVRRKSGGGTVVHDNGNVNFSFMTSKHQFDRFTFANVVVDSVNADKDSSAVKLKVNERGDIVTDVDSLKVSGSAYKVSKGKSYHHGTMLLNSRLDILGQLLHRDEEKLGVVDAMNSISSVKSKVANIGLSNETFIEIVTKGFGNMVTRDEELLENPKGPAESKKEVSEEEPSEIDSFNEMFNLSDFAQSSSTPVSTLSIPTFVIDSNVTLPQSIIDEAESLKKWGWIYGNTPKFAHTLTNEKFKFSIKFNVDKNAVIEGFELAFPEDDTGILSKEKIQSSFEYLDQVIQQGKDQAVGERLKYTGSGVAGFIINDMISDWIGESIDGTS
ncbi:putative lipoate-protein ligase A [[Candida] railenensis]|uniref:Putative lipoate-protein ligase A n=1 Tax=[Candida] railenensis TaxID=45579 RepID=A0A9P0VZ57_9ASCO|nr:putative lipoate-protein ligase A [[Candida] railenensis]